MEKYEKILGLLEEKGYIKLETKGGFDLYYKDTIKEKVGWKKLVRRIYALGNEFPLVLWFKEKRELKDEEKVIIEKEGVIPLDGNLEEMIKTKSERKRKYFMNKEQREVAQDGYLKRALCSLKYQKKQAQQKQQNYSQLTSKK